MGIHWHGSVDETWRPQKRREPVAVMDATEEKVLRISKKIAMGLATHQAQLHQHP